MNWEYVFGGSTLILAGFLGLASTFRRWKSFIRGSRVRVVYRVLGDIGGTVFYAALSLAFIVIGIGLLVEVDLVIPLYRLVFGDP